MPSLLGLDADVYFGDTTKPLPAVDPPPEGSDDDTLTPEERAALVSVLGFDPNDIDSGGGPDA